VVEIQNSELCILRGDINRSKRSHSCESRNPGKHWIPGQARNDKVNGTYVVMYCHCRFGISLEFELCYLKFILKCLVLELFESP